MAWVGEACKKPTARERCRARYNDAIQAYEELLRKFASQMDKVERQGAEDDYHTVLLLGNAPPQKFGRRDDTGNMLRRKQVLTPSVEDAEDAKGGG